MTIRENIAAVLLGTAILFGAFYWFWKMDAQKATRMVSRVREFWPRTSPGYRKFLRIMFRSLGAWFIVGATYGLIRVALAPVGGTGQREPLMMANMLGAFVGMGVLLVVFANRLSNPWNEP